MTTLAPTDAKTRGRPREFDITEALDKALVVFTERGYHATSISDLSEAMELTPGSIYKAFKDKRAVFLAALDRYIDLSAARLESSLPDTASGRERVLHVLLYYIGLSHGEQGQQGCLAVSTAIELASSDPEMAARVKTSFGKRERILSNAIRLGQSDGSIPAPVDPDDAARFFLCYLQGLRVIGKTGRSYDDLMATVDVALRTLT